MTEQLTKQVVVEIVEEIVDNAVSELSALMSRFANDVNERFDQQDHRFDQHDLQFEKLHAQYDHLLDIVDGLVVRIDDYELEQAARDYDTDRLKSWARAAGKQIKLPFPDAP